VLVGRGHETRVISDLLGRVPDGGRVRIVRGEAGIGKSALLTVGSQQARERGWLVLTASGVQTETRLPFADAQPLLLVVDDLHWVDRATCDVLAFVARRLESDPIGLLGAVRDGQPPSPTTPACPSCASVR
jgi:predicted ATPase